MLRWTMGILAVLGLVLVDALIVAGVAIAARHLATIGVYLFGLLLVASLAAGLLVGKRLM